MTNLIMPIIGVQRKVAKHSLVMCLARPSSSTQRKVCAILPPATDIYSAMEIISCDPNSGPRRCARAAISGALSGGHDNHSRRT